MHEREQKILQLAEKNLGEEAEEVTEKAAKKKKAKSKEQSKGEDDEDEAEE